MARSNTLEILSGIIDKLGPVSHMTSGMPIRADDWNAIVDSVRKLASLVSSREKTTSEFLDERFAPIDHQHPQQITLEWFEPSARKLLEDASQGAVDQRAAMVRIEADIKAIRADIDSLRAAVDMVRGELDGLRDSDFARTRAIDRLGTRVQTISSTADRFADISGRIDSMNSGLREALSFRDSLRDETGAIVNPADLKKRIGSLESIRDNLILANGSVVRMKDIESAIARLEDGTIKQNDLDEAIARRLTDSSVLDTAGITATVKESLWGDVAKKFEEEDAKTSTINESLSSLQGRMTAQETAALSLAGRMGIAENSLQSMSTLSSAVQNHEKRFNDYETRLAGDENKLAAIKEIDTRVGNLEKNTRDIPAIASWTKSAEERLVTAEKQGSRIDTLDESMNSLTRRIDAVEKKIPVMDKMASDISILQAFENDSTRRFEVYDAGMLATNRLSNRVDAVERNSNTLLAWKDTTDSRIDQIVRKSETTRPIINNPR
jgi:hypothetical protein